MQIYHNARCRKSREALALLNEAGKEVELVEYMKNPISEKELKKVIKLLKIKPYDLLRRKEKVFKEKFSDKDKDSFDWVKAMIENPSLMERPIVVNGDKAVIGRPPENVLDI